MNLFIINQYYPPDAAPTGVMLEAVVERLARDGHEVTVFCASGGYADDGAKQGGGARQAAEATVSATGDSRVRVVRIGATRFGRGSFFGKVLDYLSFYFGVAWKLATVKPRPDRVVALTTPPFLSVLVRLVTKLRGADHAHWVMDLYPDVMVAHGMLKERSVLHRVLAGLTRWGFGGKRCAGVVTLGPDMAGAVDGYLIGKGARKSDWVPLWASVLEPRKARKARNYEDEKEGTEDGGDEFLEPRNTRKTRKVEGGELVRGGEGCWMGEEERRMMVGELRGRRGWGDEEVVFLYSGNMGLGHRLGEFLGLVLGNHETHEMHEIMIGTEARVRIVFAGRGKRRCEVEGALEKLENETGGDGGAPMLELLDYVAKEELEAHLLSGDVHLASLEPGWDGTMVPSKLQGSFSIGRPVIFVGSVSSSIGRWIMESGGGWVVAPGDMDGLRTAVGEACVGEERLRRGERAKVFAGEHFDREVNAGRVAEFLTAKGAKGAKTEGRGRCG